MQLSHNGIPRYLCHYARRNGGWNAFVSIDDTLGNKRLYSQPVEIPFSVNNVPICIRPSNQPPEAGNVGPVDAILVDLTDRHDRKVDIEGDRLNEVVYSFPLWGRQQL